MYCDRKKLIESSDLSILLVSQNSRTDKLESVMNFYSLPSPIITILWPFSELFSRLSWFTSLELLLGAILCRGSRTVTGILRATGLSQKKGFSKYHRILNSLDWSPKRGSEILLKMILKMIGSERPVILIDETLER